MKRLLLVLIPALFVAVAAACGEDEEVAGPTTPPASSSPTATASGTPSVTPSVPTSATATPTQAPTPTPTGSLAYTDAAYGYAFDYPASWFLHPPSTKGASVALYSYDPNLVPSGQAGMPVPKDRLKAIIRVAEGVNTSVEQWLIDSRTGQPPVTIISSSSAVIGGLAGINEVVEDEGGLHSAYYIPLGQGRIFIIGAVPADSQVWQQFQSVLNSIRFSS
jgi:hypothetical protein